MALAGIGITAQNNDRHIIRLLTNAFKTLGCARVPVAMEIVESGVVTQLDPEHQLGCGHGRVALQARKPHTNR